MPNFVHLHTHSHYSLLDGLGKVPDLVKRAKELGMTALALTDHGSMYGTIEFYETCKKHEIKPIIGVEVYVAPRKMSDKQPGIDAKPYHLVLLAENNEGYKNLLKITSIGHLDGFYYKPRVDKDTLREYHNGVIALSACLAGEVSRALMNNDEEKAEKIALEYAEIFGKDNFFLEMQHHPEMREQVDVNEKLIRLSKKTGLQLVVTKDIHYVLKEDAEAQDVLLCIQTGKTVDDPTRLSMRKEDYSMTSPEELAEAFKDISEVLDNTVKIAERCNVEITLGEWNFPKFEIPDGKTAAEYLRDESRRRIRNLIPNPSEDVLKRLDYELDVINQKGYAAYFLIVADYVQWSRDHEIAVTTRGSAAGSLVAYAMDIVPVNPLFFNLPFERFLNPFRPSPPDIDVDFADNRRDEAVAYITGRYGKERVAQICTFGTMLARGGVRDVARSLGFPYAFGDRISKLIPMGKQGFPMTLKRAKKEVPEFLELYNTEPNVKRVVDLAERIEGCARHLSVHAAGLVISPTLLTDFSPVQREPGGEKVITQYEMKSAEKSGLIKMDILGIRNLSILGDAVRIIKKTKGVEINLQKLPLDDPKPYELIKNGFTVGVFQLSSSGMTKYLKELAPSTIFDLAAMIALYRPGPIESIPEYINRKHKKSPITYIDPRLEPILKNTYGIITYQEDIMEIAIAVAGYTWATVDKLRKAIGKKIPEEMAKQEKIFKEGCVAVGGLTAENAAKLWDLFRPFQGYGFNRAHAASYSVVSYQTAYLKAHYPSEFMAAVLTAESGDIEEVARVVEECEKMGIKVLPPDVQESLLNFTFIDDKTIRFGLIAVKNLGEEIIGTIIEERKKNGKFKDLSDFSSRIQSKNFNKKSLESMIKSGAMDSFGERGQLLANVDLILEYNRECKTAVESKQADLFSLSPNIEVSKLRLKDAPTAKKEEKLSWEKELLGLYITEHPFSDYAPLIKNLSSRIRDLSFLAEKPDYQSSEKKRGKIVFVGGIVASKKQIMTKKDEPMMFITLEDESESVEVVVFPRVFEKTKDVWMDGKPVLVAGKIDNQRDGIKILCDSATIITPEKIEEIKKKINGKESQRLKKYSHAPVYGQWSPAAETKKEVEQNLCSVDGDLFNLVVGQATSPEKIEEIKKVFAQFPGDKKVRLLIKNPAGATQKVETGFMIDGSVTAQEAIKNIMT
jgi:DNA polymerase-3 subunit alpha